MAEAQREDKGRKMTTVVRTFVEMEGTEVANWRMAKIARMKRVQTVSMSRKGRVFLSD